MPVRRSLLAICLIATLHGLFFLWYQRPDWNTQWTDQDGYRRLGAVLAATGKFTRVPDATPFVPEVIRTPAYPAFVAVIYKVVGSGQLPVAFAQIGLFVAICLLVFDTARRVAGERVALAAALTTALYPPIPYFAALIMTEVWTTFVFTLSMWACVRAIEERRTGWFVLLGFLLALTPLSRPVFILFLPCIVAMAVVIFPLIGWKARPSLGSWTVALFVFALTMLPWFTYNYVTLHRFTLSPAGGIGRGTWEGSWQAVWPGRLQAELTQIATDVSDRAELDRRVSAVAERERLPAERMLEYVHQWQDIRQIWTEPTEPHERAVARVAADQEYLRVGVDNLRGDSRAHLIKRLARGVFVLWAGEIPFRYSDIDRLPPIVIRLVWFIQALLMVAATVGVYALARTRRLVYASILAAPIVYVTAVHIALLTEARQSLPAQPIVVLLGAIGVAYLTGHLLAFETQVHERQHLR